MTDSLSVKHIELSTTDSTSHVQQVTNRWADGVMSSLSSAAVTEEERRQGCSEGEKDSTDSNRGTASSLFVKL